MYGAIYGDLVGSLYEYEEFLKHNKEKMIEASKQENLVTSDSFISDDTILTLAIKEAAKRGYGYDESLKKYILENAEPLNKENYFKYMFSPDTIKWAKGEKEGNSKGNGAIMRISPIPNTFESYLYMNNEVMLATSTSHNTEEAIDAALCVANIIYLARNGETKKALEHMIERVYKYDYDFNLDILREKMHFNYTCSETLPICLYALFNSSSFEEAIRLTLSIGGDTDTNCCIVGSMAEAFYGVPTYVKETVEEHLPEKYVKILKK